MGLVEDGKAVLGLINKAANRDLYDKLVEYLDKVFTLTTERASLQEEVAAIKKRVATLEEELAWKAKLVQKEEAMVIAGDSTSPAYCMICWHDGRKVIPLKKILGGGECGVCKNTCSLSYFRDDYEGVGRAETDFDPLG